MGTDPDRADSPLALIRHKLVRVQLGEASINGSRKAHALYGELPAFAHWLGEPTILLALGIGSAILGLGSLLALPFVLARIPTDYFTRPPAVARRGSAFWPARIAKNVLGALMLLTGVAMLVLPGQGVLTIFAALLLLDFPGKFRLVRWLVLRPRVFGVLNSLRARAGRPPLELDPTTSSRPRSWSSRSTKQ